MTDLTNTPKTRTAQGEARVSPSRSPEAHPPAARVASNTHRNTHQPEENPMNTNTTNGSPQGTKTSSSTEATERMDAFTVREFETAGEKRRDWTRIGVAFQHKDGKGYSLILQALPVDGKVELRLHEAKEKDA
ncbi:hypothetical protein [Metallibacterium sp.]|uniref:hypothetical protein n=1 Tax=Metallibacterium sp. TaxID=2940281 RepID=UPI002623E799|nr:hypothetical protein [Metallibacterium sp.]